MADNENDLSVTLPEELRRQFDAVEKRLWRVETSIALGSIITGLAISLLALFISDRLWNTPKGLRLAISLLGLAAILIPSGFWARRWVWQRRSFEDLSRLVQKRYRRLGDRLLGIVELANEQRHQSNFSPELYHAAIHQVAAEASQFDFCRSVSARPAKKIAIGAAGALACWLALALALPQASRNAFLRWAAPMAGIERYTLVQLNGLPKELIVPHGEPFLISGTVRYRSIWKPGRVTGQWLNLPKIVGAVDSGKIHLQIPGQVEDGALRVRVGDAVAEIKVTPVYRPSLRELTANIQLPGYLQYPDQTQTVQSGSLQAVEGSRISFHGKTSRALTGAVMQPPGGEVSLLKITGDSFTSAPAQPQGIAEYVFNWRDDLGLSNASPLRLSVAMQKDAPPMAELPDLPRESAMLFSDVLHIRAEASDDFGVRDLGLTWDVAADRPTADGYTSEVKIMTPSSHVKKAQKTFLWSPRTFGIPADSTVELQGYARDYFPNRERSRTPAYHIRILSQEEHAELIRGELEDVMARMEEVTRLQEKIVANLHDLQGNEKLSESQKSEHIGQSKNDQLENSSHLDELSQRAASAVQEAMKNPLFTPDTIRKWSKSAQQWQQMAEEKMKDAASAMKAAQQSPHSRQQEMAGATQKAEEILKMLEKMQDAASHHMDDLQALTLAQRLRKIGAQEKDIAGQLIKTAPDTIGLPPEDLPEKFKHFEHLLTTDQGRADKESDTLQGEISRFFERTKSTNYGEVSQEMKDTHTTDELDRLAGMISDNIGVQASAGLGDWSARFEKWGEKLEPKPSSSGGGEGSGSKSKKRDLTEQLIALLRLRENEMNLRDQTTLLDQQKGEPSAYKEHAVALAATQAKLGGNLDHIRQDVAVAELDTAFAETGETMVDRRNRFAKARDGQTGGQRGGQDHRFSFRPG